MLSKTFHSNSNTILRRFWLFVRVKVLSVNTLVLYVQPPFSPMLIVLVDLECEWLACGHGHQRCLLAVQRGNIATKMVSFCMIAGTLRSVYISESRIPAKWEVLVFWGVTGQCADGISVFVKSLDNRWDNLFSIKLILCSICSGALFCFSNIWNAMGHI